MTNRFLRIYITFLLSVVCAVAASAAVPKYYTTYPVSGTLPVLYIETEYELPILNTTDYVTAGCWLDPMGTAGVDALGSETEPVALQIRGRGHSSWKAPKKPYKLKFAKKTAIMGMPKNKHFALLKPSENTVAGLHFGKLLNMAWTPSFRPVEVVLNHDYIGLYFLTETIRIDENRVNIYEQADGETDPDLIKGGWLVEVDNYRDDNQITLRENGTWVLWLRYHSPENLSGEQLAWLREEFTALNVAIYSEDKTSTEWEKYVDVEGMARYFIVQELMDNPDGFHGSFYLHKDLKDNAKWVAGPVWDLVCYYREKTDYTFRLPAHYGFTPHWIGRIIEYPNFCKAVEKVWEEVYPKRVAEIYDEIDRVVLPLAAAWKKDAARWGDDATQTASLRAERLKNALRGNIEWFDQHLPESPYASLTSLPTADAVGPVTVYNLFGMCAGMFDDEAEALSRLPKGLYIIKGRKFVVN